MTPEQVYYLQFSGELVDDGAIVIQTDEDLRRLELAVEQKWREEHQEVMDKYHDQTA